MVEALDNVVGKIVQTLKNEGLYDNTMIIFTLFWHYPHYGNQGGKPASCIMEGDWKLIKWYTANNAVYELFNLATDIGEQYNLENRYPKTVKVLKRKLETFLVEANAQFPIENPRFK